MPKISIVLPTYNGEKYIQESIESIINQTFKDWELIIVNDCSNDNTSLIVNEYIKKDNRIRVINNNENKKLPASLNVGFNNAKGEYYTWTSDDNLYKNIALEVMYDFLEKNKKYQMVCAGMNYVDENGKKLYKHIQYSDELMYYNDCVGACFLYRKTVVDDIGEYNIDKFCIEDYEYWMRVLKKYGTIGYINKSLYDYRVHEESLTATKKDYINNQLLKYRESELDWILDNLETRPDLIVRMYCDFIGSKEKNFFLKKANKRIPELSLLKDNVYKKNYIVWGAGHYGMIANKILGDRVKYFADTNEEIVGKSINGVKIISYDEMIKEKNMEICIAVWDGKIYDMLKKLYETGIKRCSLVQEFM